MLTEKDFTPEEWKFIQDNHIQLTETRTVDINIREVGEYPYKWLLARLAEVPPQYHESCTVSVDRDDCISLNWQQPKTREAVLFLIEAKKKYRIEQLLREEQMCRRSVEMMTDRTARMTYKYLKERLERGHNAD